MTARRFLQWLFIPVIVASLTGSSSAQTLRIVSWNTANDVGNNGTDTHTPTTNGPAANVLQAIGALNVSGSTRPIDVLALQESVYFTGGPGMANPTATAYAAALNTVFPGGNYQVASLVNGTTTGATAGNGPQSLVFRSSSLTLLSQQALGTPSGTSIARQVMLYQFQPIGYNSTASFYMFNSHFKSGTTTDDDNRRGNEGSLIASTANGLPTNSAIIFGGDFNPTNSAADQGYATVVAGTGTHNNRGIDPITTLPTNWSSNTATARAQHTFSPATSEFFNGQGTGGMNFRDDLLLNSPGMVSGNGISYINGSFVVFGNTGNHNFQQAITTGANSASAFAAQLTGYNAAQAMGVLTSLSQASDHLPVVADYRITAVPEPMFVLLVVAGAAGGVAYVRRRREFA